MSALGDPPGPGSLLAARHDVDALRAQFALHGRVVVPDLLTPGFAAELHACLDGWTRWALVTRVEGRHYNFDAAAMAAIPASEWAKLEGLIAAEARVGLQYLYERYPLYDPHHAPEPVPPVLDRFRGLLGGGPFIELSRRITGADGIAFGDAQATRYRKNHFLTLHDDAEPEKRRLVAYVLSLTPEWAADFGGQLQFVDADGQIEQVVMPRFNTLSLFRVPRTHLVSAVAPFVERPRLSITGWLREGGDRGTGW